MLEKQTYQLCDDKNYNHLKDLVYKLDMKMLSQYLVEYNCIESSKKLYDDLTKDIKTENFNIKYKSMLMIIRGFNLKINSKESLECFDEAMLLYPNEETKKLIKAYQF